MSARGGGGGGCWVGVLIASQTYQVNIARVPALGSIGQRPRRISHIAGEGIGILGSSLNWLWAILNDMGMTRWIFHEVHMCNDAVVLGPQAISHSLEDLGGLPGCTVFRCCHGSSKAELATEAVASSCCFLDFKVCSPEVSQGNRCWFCGPCSSLLIGARYFCKLLAIDNRRCLV